MFDVFSVRFQRERRRPDGAGRRCDDQPRPDGQDVAAARSARKPQV